MWYSFNTNKKFMKFHPKYGYWGTPNYHKTTFMPEYSRSITITHDNFGNREIPVIENMLNKSGKILFFGGSHTWGGGVENFETYSAIVQQFVNYECVNCGQCSVGLDQMILALIDQMETDKPSHVIIELHPWVVHRVLRKSAIGFPKPYIEIHQNKFVFKNIAKINRINIFRNISSKYLNFEKALLEYRAGIDTSGVENHKTADPLFTLWNQGYYENMYKIIQFLLQTAKSICLENDIKLLVVLGPTKQELEFNPEKINFIDPSIPRIRLRSQLEELKISFLDLQKNFQSISNETNNGIYSDGHINPLGHEIFANAIIEWITLSD
jgi:hypothetical protein